MRRRRIGVGIHGNGRNAQLAARPYDAHRDFPAVGDKDFSKHSFLRSSVPSLSVALQNPAQDVATHAGHAAPLIAATRA